ncbi:hypothetical protein CRENBAI_022452 [Crenichthys baileyi]|uniref:Uncharacterized protein n=1 Tax=Crenichthys baileyi TaxID=28760 RepID=A0AAV9RI54_9TELE
MSLQKQTVFQRVPSRDPVSTTPREQFSRSEGRTTGPHHQFGRPTERAAPPHSYEGDRVRSSESVNEEAVQFGH